MSKNKITISARMLYDGKSKGKDVTVTVEGDRILDVEKTKRPADIEGFVTPAFIDPHSHIGMERQGEPVAESEVDDFQRAICALNDPVNSIYFDDRAFEEAVDFGVLYSCVVPGSGNLVGGRAVTIKNFVTNRKDAVIGHYGYKMALGYNPRSVYKDWKGIRHNTRMGNASLLDQEFSEVLRLEQKALITRDKALLELNKKTDSSNFSRLEINQKKDWIQKEYELSLSAEQWAVFDLLSGNKTVKAHVHKEDDAFYLIDLKKKYNLKVTAEHTCSICDVNVFKELAANDIPIVYGPMSSMDYKVELVHASYKNAVPLMASGAKFGLMTDHPVILSHQLRDCLKFFLIQGMPPEKAIGLITRDNANILNLDHLLGTIEPGKLASLVVWDKDPFNLAAFPKIVMAEGRIVRDNR